MLSFEDFLSRYPEFKTAPEDLVEGCLEDAALRTDPEVLGDLTDHAHGLLAAHLLSISPWGRGSRLQKDTRGTTYEDELHWIQRARGSGWGVL